MTYRKAKQRTLQKAGFAYVAGWVEKEDAPNVEALIEKALPNVTAALSSDEVTE